MKSDEIIKRRFNELALKADKVSQTRGGEYNNYVDHELFYDWGTSVLSLLQQSFGESSIHYRNFLEKYQDFDYYFSSFAKCRGIFSAAKEDHEAGYLFNFRSLVKAEVLDDALEQAEELLDAGYKDPSCVLIGVSLEIALKDLCSRNNVSDGKMDRMNVELRKKNVYNMVKQKQITAWADLRNKAAHGDWSAYNEADVRNFLQGTRQFISDYL